MTDYIPREAVLEFVEPDARPFLAERIKSIPAADVRPVVLCKDCDCWNEWDSAGREGLGNYVCSCAHWSVEDGPILYTSPTDFCSYGEKREES